MSDADKRQRRIGLVECPRCKESGEITDCKLCNGAGVVSVDTAIEWQIERDSLLPSEKKKE